MTPLEEFCLEDFVSSDTVERFFRPLNAGRGNALTRARVPYELKSALKYTTRAGKNDGDETKRCKLKRRETSAVAGASVAQWTGLLA